MKYRVGIDVGGTFTDFVSIDEQGRVKVVKSSSTPLDPSIGMENAIIKSGINLKDLSILVHGCTVGANTVIENKGAKTAIITTKGFRDVIELRRGQRVIDKPNDMYNLQMDLPQDYVGGYSPLVSRPYRFEIPERLDYRGNILEPLDEAAVREAAAKCKAMGVESVVVCYYFSFVNPVHEQRTKEILQEMLPGVCITLSTEVLPIIREYERLSTATINGYIMPIMQKYLSNVRTKLEKRGYNKEYYVMQSNGGIMSAEVAGQRPVYALDSGPAGGVIAAADLGMRLGFPNVLSFDMGGTTAKVCLICDGKPAVTTNFWADGKYFIGVPIMDMVEIGAGGGSMAWIDHGGAVHVGPQSAGADPGPVAYKLGGVNPTVTDCDMILGYINSDYFLGGDMKVDVEASKSALKEKVAEKLGMSVAEAAHGVYRLVNANMMSAMRIITVQRGYDPRDFSMVVSGGTGAIHAVRMAQELHMPRVIVPLTPGTFSAVGLITADARYDVHRSYVARTSNADPARIEKTYRELAEEATARIKELGFKDEEIEKNYEIEMRYLGQAHEVRFSVPSSIFGEAINAGSLRQLEQLFHERHKYLFGHASTEATVEIITLSVSAMGAIAKSQLFEIEEGTEDPKEAWKKDRKVYFEEYKDYVDCPTYERSRLKANNVMIGPAVVEQMDTTTVIPPRQRAVVDKYGNIIIDIVE